MTIDFQQTRELLQEFKRPVRPAIGGLFLQQKSCVDGN